MPQSALRSAPNFAQARLNMVDGQIKPFSVVEKRILDAFLNTPREMFVPEAQQGLAYLGEDLPLGRDRFLLEPAAHARLVQDAEIKSDHQVLDVACLTGYSSAILSQLAGQVTAIDHTEWIEQARQIAQRTGYSKINFMTGEDNCKSNPGPVFDVIVINGAVQFIPPAISSQVKDGGRIATFIRNARGEGHAALFHKHKNGLHQQILFDAFVPLLPGFMQEEAFVF